MSTKGNDYNTYLITLLYTHNFDNRSKLQIRYRDKDSRLQKKAKRSNLIEMNTKLSTLFDGNIRNTTTIMELNTTQFKRIKENCISTSRLSKSPKGNNIYYDFIRYGKNLCFTKEHLKFDRNKKIVGSISTSQRVDSFL